MSRNLIDYVVPEDDGHCHWRGTVLRANAHGKPRPTWRTHEARQHPDKLMFEAYYGIELGSQRITRACADETCIAPRHHLLTAPASLLKELVTDMALRTSLIYMLRSQASTAGLQLSCEDPVTFGLESHVALDLAERMGVPVLAVLAGYGRAFREHQHRHQPDSLGCAMDLRK